MTDQINVGNLLEEPAPQVSVQVSVHGAQVVLHFNAPREYVALTGLEPLVVGTRLMALAIEADDSAAQQMINLCMGLIDYAYEQRSDLKPAGGAVKHEMIERHRRLLTQRLAVMLNSQREKKTITNRALAKQIVDVMLKEVFS